VRIEETRPLSKTKCWVVLGKADLSHAGDKKQAS
jgi:ribosomal protein S17